VGYQESVIDKILGSHIDFKYWTHGGAVSIKSATVNGKNLPLCLGGKYTRLTRIDELKVSDKNPDRTTNCRCLEGILNRQFYKNIEKHENGEVTYHPNIITIRDIPVPEKEVSDMGKTISFTDANTGSRCFGISLDNTMKQVEVKGITQEEIEFIRTLTKWMFVLKDSNITTENIDQCLAELTPFVQAPADSIMVQIRDMKNFRNVGKYFE
jgi:hypothetical protein